MKHALTLCLLLAAFAQGAAGAPRAGKADIGMASRELTPRESALFAILIARDGVVFVVHKDNPGMTPISGGAA